MATTRRPSLADRLAAEKAGQRRRFLADLAERTARTFVQGFLSVVSLDALSDGVSLNLREKLAAGGLAGAFAVLTAFAAKKTGAPDSASLLPADVDPPQDDHGHADTNGLITLAIGLVIVLILLRIFHLI